MMTFFPKKSLVSGFLLLATLQVSVWMKAVNAYDYGDPSVAEQAFLEGLNRIRLNPQAEATRLGVDLLQGIPPGTVTGEPIQPLTFNAQLLQAARIHSQDMLDQEYFSHVSLDGRLATDRVKAIGYPYKDLGENIAMRGHTHPLDEIKTAVLMNEDLFIDKDFPNSGHRQNILQPKFKEAGIGIAPGSYDPYTYSYLLTCLFGSSLQEQNSFLLGVVYDDRDGDGVYTGGEGVGNVTIRIPGTGAETRTASAGGYGIPLPSGDYAIEAVLSDDRVITRQVSIKSENIKLDFRLGGDVGSSDNTILIDTDEAESEFSFVSGQKIHLKFKTEQGQKIWVLIQLPSLFPGLEFVRPSDEYCEQNERYVFPFFLPGTLVPEADSLYYDESYSSNKIDFGINNFEGLGEIIFTIKKGRSSNTLETIQTIRVIPR